MEIIPFSPVSEHSIRCISSHRIVEKFPKTAKIPRQNREISANLLYVFAKIINAAKKAKKDENYVLELGNLDSIREFGDAKDYANAVWLTLQCDKPNDFVI